jgi:hypothetical protein
MTFPGTNIASDGSAFPKIGMIEARAGQSSWNQMMLKHIGERMATFDIKTL